MYETRSIYHGKTKFAEDPVKEYAMEITTIDNLLNCGMENSNGINLRDRLNYLNGEIERIENLRKQSRRGN
jgi:hypothetical protein